MANLITSGFLDFPSTYAGSADKFLRVNSTANAVVFTRAELSDLYKVEITGANLPTNGQALVYNSAADRWRPSTLDVYSAGNGINKSGLTLNVTAGVGGGLVSNVDGVFITDIANVAGTYGNSTLIPTLTVNSKGQVTAVTVSQANAQYAHGLTANYVGSVAGTAGQIVVTGGTGNNANAVFDLVATGITAGWYGNVRPNGQYVIPAVDVDSYGRVRQIVEVPIAFDANGNVIPASNITSYSVFRVEGQTSIIADQPEDTVSFIAGNGMEITTNAANDSITFSANTSALFANTSISAFSDVGSLSGIQGDQILIWSNITGKFEYGNTVSGAGTIISSDTVPDAPANSALWYDQVSGRLYILYDGTWVDAAPAGGGVNLLAVSSNILPSANAVYSLGNATLQWKDLWVAGNTIHIGNVPVGMSSGKLTVANAALATEAFVSSAVANVSVDLTGYATESYVTSATANGNTAYSWGNHANASYLTANANAITTADPFTLTANSSTWTFQTNPVSTEAAIVMSGSSIIETNNGRTVLFSYGGNAGPELAYANASTYADVSTANVMYNSVYVNQGGFFIDVDYNDVVGYKGWYFGTLGEFVFPDGTEQLTAYNGTEPFSNLSSATGVVTHDCANGRVFYHDTLSNNFTANLTNLILAVGSATSVTLVLAQGGTAYVCNALQIAGNAQSILWQGSASAPTGNANKTDTITFSIMRTGPGTTDYVVLGQLVSFG